MELQKVIIENFKCFRSKTEIDFGKLTLLTGANSSGKSSIIYSVLGAIQSGEFPWQFSTNGKYVNMGDFNEIVFGHDKKQNIKLGYVFKNGLIHQINTEWKENSTNKLPELVRLNAFSEYYKLSLEYKNKKYIVDFKYDPENDPQLKAFPNEAYKDMYLNFTSLIAKYSKANKDKSNSNEDEDFLKILNDLNIRQDIKGITLSQIPLDYEVLSQNGGFKLKQIFDLIEKLFKSFDNSINFISSFRLHPDRGYLETSKTDLKISNDGKGYLDQIINWESKKSKKFKELIETITELGLISGIKTKRSEGGKYDIIIKTKENGVFTSLYDVGFGISQFLPIVVADLQLPKLSSLFVAQPEIHLHPKVQSLFGDYLVKQITKNNKRYIIETHSEYLLNKIRLSIVKGEIKEKDISVIFLDNQTDESKIYKIEFTKKGQIINAPGNFFDTYMIDVMDIAINAAED